MSAIQVYTAPQILDKTAIVYAAKTTFLQLASIVFLNRDLKNVEQEIADLSKIRFGLIALDQTELTKEIEQKILVTLTRMCGIYNQQIIPTIN